MGVINGKDGTANFSIAGVLYATLLDMFRIREVTEMTNADTFSIEGTADQEPGRSQLVGELTGIGKKEITISGPLIPAPQNVAVVATYSVGCTITLQANFTEASADRMVNQNMRIGGRFISKAAYTVTWDVVPGP
jgi:hypothetical protein